MSELQPVRRRGIELGRSVQANAQPEVLEAPFPDRRTLQWMPPDKAAIDDFAIVITADMLLQTSWHVSRTLAHETGGFLLGNRYRCPNSSLEYIIIDQLVEADYTEATEVSLTFTHDAWAQLDDKLTGKYYGKKLVGWYHSHPGMGIFLSDHDITIHAGRFSEPWMVALVIEPVKHLGGFFAWDNGKIDPNRYMAFHELLDSEGRESVVAWTNYSGVDPVSGVVPVVGKKNTQTKRPTGAVVLTPQVKPKRHLDFLPDWLAGNIVWFGAAAIALAVFLTTAILIYKNVNAPVDVAGTNNTNSSNNGNRGGDSRDDRSEQKAGQDKTGQDKAAREKANRERAADKPDKEQAARAAREQAAAREKAEREAKAGRELAKPKPKADTSKLEAEKNRVWNEMKKIKDPNSAEYKKKRHEYDGIIANINKVQSSQAERH